MTSFHDLFVVPLTETFFIKSLIGGSMVAIVSGVVGCLVILRRMSFLGDALSHAMIAGVAGGYLVMKLLFGIEAHAPAMLIGSLIAAVLTVGLIGFVSRISRIKEDTAIGIMYTGVFAAGVVAVSIFRNHIHIDLMHFIMGDVLGIADSDLWASAITCALVLTVILFFFRQFQLTSFDPIMAASIGMPVLFIDYALTTCVSLVVVSAVSMVGVILVVGLLITPAATAYLMSDRLDRMMMLAAFFGLTSVVGGLYLCVWLDASGGGAIMLFCTFQFLVALFLAPRYGILARWIRTRRMIPQQLLEDILGTLVRFEPVTEAELLAHMDPNSRIKKALKTLVAGRKVLKKSNGYQLSETGRQEATAILRAHRLWETYLSSVGVAEGDIHAKAHELEHIRDTDSVEYLDDLLGHPETDPHGKIIPEPEALLESDEPIPISRLREGRVCTITSTRKGLTPPGLMPGDRLIIGDRKKNGTVWVAHKPDGSEITFTHEAADVTHVVCDQKPGFR